MDFILVILISISISISILGASKINPDVVIQAGEVKNVSETTAGGTATTATSTTTPFTTLSSTTVTTNVNTSPISSPVVPILKKGVIKKSPNKRVTFNIPSSLSAENVSKPQEVQATETPPTVEVSSLSTAASSTTSTFTFGTSASTIQAPVSIPTAVETSKEQTVTTSNFMASSTTSLFSSKAPQDRSNKKTKHQYSLQSRTVDVSHGGIPLIRSTPSRMTFTGPCLPALNREGH